jgi:hypothetical protein
MRVMMRVQMATCIQLRQMLAMQEGAMGFTQSARMASSAQTMALTMQMICYLQHTMAALTNMSAGMSRLMTGGLTCTMSAVMSVISIETGISMQMGTGGETWIETGAGIGTGNGTGPGMMIGAGAGREMGTGGATSVRDTVSVTGMTGTVCEIGMKGESVAAASVSLTGQGANQVCAFPLVVPCALRCHIVDQQRQCTAGRCITYICHVQPEPAHLVHLVV